MNKKLLASQQSIFITVIISAVSLVAVVYFGLFPYLANFQQIAQQIKDKKTGLIALKTPAEEYGALEEKVKTLGGRREALKNKLVWESDISSFLTRIIQLASDLKIEFVSLRPEVRPSPSEKVKGLSDDYMLTEVPIVLIIKSNYGDLIQFLERIEQSDKFIGVESFSIDTQPLDIYTHSIRMDLSIFAKEKR